MIFPSKHLNIKESLFWLWSIIISILDKPKTIDSIWKELKEINIKDNYYIDFDWLILVLDYLFMIWILSIENNKIKVCN